MKEIIRNGGDIVKSLLVYSTRSGNTKLVADEIAGALGCRSINLDEMDFNKIELSGIDNIFIGSGVYGGKMGQNTIKFVKLLNDGGLERKSPVRLSFFTTWLGRANSALSAIENCKKVITSKDVNFSEEPFISLGESFRFIRKGHPDKVDLENSKKWALKIVS